VANDPMSWQVERSLRCRPAAEPGLHSHRSGGEVAAVRPGMSRLARRIDSAVTKATLVITATGTTNTRKSTKKNHSMKKW
jgi:hypothetical protein